MNFDFQFEACRSRSADFQKRAVLYPLLGSKNVDQKILRLLQLWRYKSNLLRGGGWVSAQGLRLQYIKNCPPAMVKNVRPRSRKCRLVHICPFCYARKVGAIFERVKQATQSLKDQKVPHDLAILSLAFDFDMEDPALEHNVVLLLRQRSRHRQQLESYASVVHSTVEPKVPDPLCPALTVHIRGIFVLPEGGPFTCWRKSEPDMRISNPTVDTVVRRLAPILRYPKSLFRANTDTTIRLLELVHGQKMTLFGGLCYGPQEVETRVEELAQKVKAASFRDEYQQLPLQLTWDD